jgi:hypothetical protein
LRPDETWETWLEISQLPATARDNAYTLARARLSTTRVITSVRNASVPPVGVIPGGPVRVG